MTKNNKALLLSISAMAIAITSLPARAAGITNATVNGTSGINYYLYEALDINPVDGTLDTTKRNNSASLNTILQGNCTVVAGACSVKGSPRGNIELFANSETSTYANLNNFATAPVTTLSGQINNNNISLSSLNGTDWFKTSNGLLNYTYGANNLANKWFNDVLNQTGLQTTLTNLSISSSNAYNLFLSSGGFQRFSDPNISYVNQDNLSSNIKIGLAGHYNTGDVFADPQLKLLFNGKQISEVIKVNYNGKTSYEYNFSAALSGLKEFSDNKSHNGNFEISLPVLTGFNGTPPATTPERSTILALISFVLLSLKIGIKERQSY